MDLVPIAFLLLFVVLSGVIAVMADNVGRKIGKSRLRVGKLRPKHTAMLGTFLMGVTISLLTIALVAISSSDVRRWIREGASAIEQRNNALRDLKGVRDELSTQDKRNKELDKDIREKTKQVEDQKKRLEKLNADIKRLQPEITRLEGLVAKADTRIRQLDKERAKTQNELSLRKTALVGMEKDLRQVRADLKKVSEQREHQEQLTKAAAKDKEETDKKNLELTIENLKLEDGVAKLTKDIEQLGRDKQDLEVARERARTELEGAREQLTAYQTQLSDTQNQLSDLNRQLMLASAFYNGITSQTRQQPMMYGFGEEVARMALDSGLSVNQSEDALTSLLRSARLAAAARGAKRNGDYLEAGIVEHKDWRTNEPISPEQIVRQITQQIAGASGPVVLVASSSQNAFRGEPVSLEIEVLPNPMVYTKGQVIAEAKIDGHKGEEVILKQLEDFFSTRIRDRAKSDKMIARRGTDQYGEVSPGDIYRLMDQVKAADRQVRVQALALNDTRAGDPLKLDFRLR